MCKTLPLNCEFPAKFEEISRIGPIIRRASAVSVQSEDAEKIELIIVELANNIVEHGFDFGNFPGIIRLSIVDLSDKICITVADNAEPFDPRSSQDSPLSEEAAPSDIEDLPEGGMGLGLIFSLAQTVHYRRDGPWNVVEIEFAKTVN
jgi:serine/threonine-protein kinase RsbW